MDVDNQLVLAANLLLALHFIYVSFVVLGETAIIVGWIFRWHWIRSFIFRMVHLAAILIVAALDILDVPCPLTIWEYHLRERAGQLADWEMTFIERLLRSVVFCSCPAIFFNLIYIGFAALVILTLILVPPRCKKNNERQIKQ